MRGRVLHVLTSTQRRGAEVLATELAAALDSLGWASSTVALTGGVEGGLPVPVLGGERLAVGTLRALRGRVREAEVVVAHGSSTLPACTIAGAGLGVPIVYRSVGDPRYWAPTRSKRIRTAVLMRRAARVVALSDEAAAALVRHYRLRRNQLVVIPKGVAVDRLPARTAERSRAARLALGLPAEPRIALYLGALSPEKDVGAAIRAIARIPGLHLVVAGDGPDRAELEGLAHRMAADRVRFLGAVADPVDVLTAADVLVLPSRTEGMPGVAMEAGIVGLPVVATDVGWVRTIVQDGITGIVVSPGHTGALEQGIRTALDDQPRLGAAAREHCLARFDMAKLAPRWSVALADLL